MTWSCNSSLKVLLRGWKVHHHVCKLILKGFYHYYRQNCNTFSQIFFCMPQKACNNLKHSEKKNNIGSAKTPIHVNHQDIYIKETWFRTFISEDILIGIMYSMYCSCLKYITCFIYNRAAEYKYCWIIYFKAANYNMHL